MPSNPKVPKITPKYTPKVSPLSGGQQNNGKVPAR